MEAIAPTSLAEEWDNVGLLAGDATRAVTRVLLCVDCTREVVERPARAQCEAIVAYHPPIFAAMKRVTAPSIAFELVSRGIAVYSPRNTALDACEGGTNDVLADAVGMTERAPIRPLDCRRAVQARHVRPRGRAREGERRALRGRVRAHRELPGVQLSLEGGRHVLRRGRGESGGRREGEARDGRRGAPRDRRADRARPDAVRALRAAHPYQEPAFDLVKLDDRARGARDGAHRIDREDRFPARRSWRA